MKKFSLLISFLLLLVSSSFSQTHVLDPTHGGIPTCKDTSGSGSAQSCTTTTPFTPVQGSAIVYVTTTANSGSLTVNVNSIGIKHVRKWLGAVELVASPSADLPANTPVLMVYDGSTYWEMMAIGNPPISYPDITDVNGVSVSIGVPVTLGTGSLQISGVRQSGTSVTVPAGKDFSLFIGSDNHIHCQLSVSLGGGSCN